jgi:hypothetical protein
MHSDKRFKLVLAQRAHTDLGLICCDQAATDARKSAVSIQDLDYSDSLSLKLTQFADKMEKSFKDIQSKVRAGIRRTTKFARLYVCVD